MVIKPAITHATSTPPGPVMSRVDSAETMKIPEPIIDPTTIMMASRRPSVRTNPGSPGGLPWLVTVIFPGLEFARVLTAEPHEARAQIQRLPAYHHAHRRYR